MKVTVLLPEDLIEEVKKFSGGKNITECILIGLQDYVSHQQLKKSMQLLEKKPLQFISFMKMNKRSKNQGS